MAYQSLAEFIADLETQNDLVRIDAPVDPVLELTEIADRVMKSPNGNGGKALLFTNVLGSDIPVLINAFGSLARMTRALGVKDFAEIADRLAALLHPELPASLREKLARLPQLAQLASFSPKRTKNPPCQQTVLTGHDASLDRLPLLQCWPNDGGKYFTMAGVYTRHPVTGKRNAGLYRVQKLSPHTCALHWQIHHDGAQHCREYAARNEKMPVALVLGDDPAVTYAASAPIPPEMDELLFAGFLRKKPVEIAPAVSIDLDIPANADIVVEGIADPNDLVTEGPFGDHTGYYTPPDLYPRFSVTAITMRNRPVLPATVVGAPPMEDYYIGLATERIFLPAVRMTLPEIVDYHLPACGVFHNFTIVSIKKEYPYHARKVMHALWGLGQLMFSKFIIVVDDHVNVHNLDDVLFHVGANVDPRRDTCLVDGPVDALDHAAPFLCAGSKMGIDATRKRPGEGIIRPWPEKTAMTPDIIQRVTQRWPEFGLDSDSS